MTLISGKMLVELQHQADAFSLVYIHQLHGFIVTMKYFSIARVTEMVSKITACDFSLPAHNFEAVCELQMEMSKCC